MSSESRKQRIAVYVDGFNLYYGLKEKGLRRYYWLDPYRLAGNLLLPGQRLVKVRYFTARISTRPGDRGKGLRQKSYLEALGTLSDVDIHFGYYLEKRTTCFKCGATRPKYEEKMTDVNISVELISDAMDDAFDTAIIISADSDLTRAIETVRGRFPTKRVVIAFPPKRGSKRLTKEATATLRIGPQRVRDSQLPDRIRKEDGFVITRPPEWA